VLMNLIDHAIVHSLDNQFFCVKDIVINL